MVRILTCLAIGLALVMAGCGGDEPTTTQEPASTEAPVTEQTPEATATEGGTTDEAGRERFVSTCGGCHTLSAAGTNGRAGPNLDDLAPEVEQVVAAIETGPGQMPENLLEGEEAQQVAEYVAASAGN